MDFLVSQESYPKLKKVLDEAKDTNKNEVTLSYKITGIERSLQVVKRKRNKKRLKQLMFYPSQITATIKN